MIEWWDTLSIAMKVLWGITLTASLIFVIQSIMTFIGADVDSGFDIDTDFDGAADGGTGMNLLTFRNLVNFFLGFGWTAILLKEQIDSTTLLLVSAALVGAALVTAMMFLFKWLSSMQESGNINVFKQAEGCEGKVYLTIPAGRSGEGKVQVTINNAVREYEAVTDGESLPTGTQIRVIEAISYNTLLVEKIDSIII